MFTSQRIIKHSQQSVILRLPVFDANFDPVTTLAYNSSGLVISVLPSNSGTATQYASANSTIEDITSPGTYEAPSASKCRFKKANTNIGNIYEIHLADARYATSGARFLYVHINTGAAGVPQHIIRVDLWQIDPYTAPGDRTVSESATAGTVDHCLNAARAQVFGKWVVDPAEDEFTIYKSDGTTPLVTHDLTPNAARPNARAPQ